MVSCVAIFAHYPLSIIHHPSLITYYPSPIIIIIIIIIIITRYHHIKPMHYTHTPQNSTLLLCYLYANSSSFSFSHTGYTSRKPKGKTSFPLSLFLSRVILTYLPFFMYYRRSAAEIDELYERRVPAWRWSRTRTDAEVQMEAVVQVKGHVKQV